MACHTCKHKRPPGLTKKLTQMKSVYKRLLQSKKRLVGSKRRKPMIGSRGGINNLAHALSINDDEGNSISGLDIV